ncbi:putative transcription factor MYB-HB-like family [Lupinus albus]|uniref:MYB transcription factor n=1 Tax=Lupinus albus TaxID=3870 RepID=A0A6A4N813_LUPAL|nr:putative transcription factor MYB-HB-like family [Lupinus albus]
MGNQKQKWTADEEDALHRGVQKYGAGKWKNILKDPDFAPFLTSRSNIDLKDKWRNLNVSNGQGGPKDKSRTSKPKAILASASTPAASSALVPFTAPLSVVPAPQSNIVDDPSSNAEDSKNPPRYNALVFEALSAIKDANGSDANAISSFIKQNHKVPTNFRRALSTRLKRLVSQGKIEKVQNGYRMKEAPSGTKSPSPSPKPKDAWPRQSPASSFVSCSETVREAAATAAYRIAEAENKAFLAAEAFKEVDRLSQMAEDNEVVLRLVTQMYEQSLRGEVVRLD